MQTPGICQEGSRQAERCPGRRLVFSRRTPGFHAFAWKTPRTRVRQLSTRHSPGENLGIPGWKQTGFQENTRQTPGVCLVFSWNQVGNGKSPENPRLHKTVGSVGKIRFILVKRYSHIFAVLCAVENRCRISWDPSRGNTRDLADRFPPGGCLVESCPTCCRRVA